MGLVSYFYRKNFICRHDKEVGVPYFSYQDFKGLKQEDNYFISSRGYKLRYFYFYYDNYKEDKIIFFCHGLGAGHAAYFAEINALAKRGYKVLTLDYTGCLDSEGKDMVSLTEPARNVIELLDYLKLKQEIVLVGHSLGGFTALNVINMRQDIKTAVILSGFLSISLTMKKFLKSKFVISRVLKYESKMGKEYYALDNIEYLKTTKDKIFFIQSDDDPIIPYDVALKVVEQIDNPNVKTLRLTGRKHNPNYTDEAVRYMNEVFGVYYQLIKDKKIRTDQEKIAYFKDKSIAKMTEQDPQIFDQIIAFIEQ